MAPPLAPCLLGGRTAAVSDPVPPAGSEPGPLCVRGALPAAGLWPGWDEPRAQLQPPTQPRPACPAFAIAAQVTAASPRESSAQPRLHGRGRAGGGSGACPVCNVPGRVLLLPCRPPHTPVSGSGLAPSLGGCLPQTAPQVPALCPAAAPVGPWRRPSHLGRRRLGFPCVGRTGGGDPGPPRVGWGTRRSRGPWGHPHLLTFGACLVAVSPWPAPAQWPPGGKGPAHVRPPFFPPRSHGCENPSWAIPHLSPVFPALRPLSALPGSAGEEAGAPLPEPGAGRSEGRGRRHGGPPSGPQAAAPGREFYFDAMKILFIYNVYIF